MPCFDYQVVPVRLVKEQKVAAMVIRSDYTPADHAVVFADPKKLKPYLDAIEAESPAGPSKRQDGADGLACASVNFFVDPATAENVLPMAKVNCCWLEGETAPRFTFSDGITRCQALLEAGADFVPLEVSNAAAAMLHNLVGLRNRPPKSAAGYVLPEAVRMERIRAAYRGTDSDPA